MVTRKMISPVAAPAVEEILSFDLPESTLETSVNIEINQTSPSSSSSCESRQSTITMGGIGTRSSIGNSVRKQGVHGDEVFAAGFMTPPEHIARTNSHDLSSMLLSSSRRRRKRNDGASGGIRSPQVGSDLLVRALQKTCVSVRFFASQKFNVTKDLYLVFDGIMILLTNWKFQFSVDFDP